MSIQQARTFLSRLEESAELRAAVAAASTRQDRQRIAMQAGFTFTGAEFVEASHEFHREELTEDQLDVVAGGSNAGAGTSMADVIALEF